MKKDKAEEGDREEGTRCNTECYKGPHRPCESKGLKEKQEQA